MDLPLGCECKLGCRRDKSCVQQVGEHFAREAMRQQERFACAILAVGQQLKQAPFISGHGN